MAQFAPDHHRDQRVAVEGGNVLRRDVTAVLENRNRVAKPEYLVEPMADVEDQLALLAHGGNQLGQFLDFGLVERRGWFIEDED